MNKFLTCLITVVTLSRGNFAAAQTPVDSFGALQRVLHANQRVLVTTTDGQKTYGRVLAISANELPVARKLRFYRTEERRFASDGVGRVEAIDSLWNGWLIGAGTGAALAEVVDRNHEPIAGNFFFPWALWTSSVALGGVAGSTIDALHNRTVFDAGKTSRTIRVIPLMGTVTGVRASVRFGR